MLRNEQNGRVMENELYTVHEALDAHEYSVYGDIRRCACGNTQIRMSNDNWRNTNSGTPLTDDQCTQMIINNLAKIRL